MWSAFLVLSAQRLYTDKGAPQPISIADIYAYGRITEAPDAEFLLHVMNKMDHEFLTVQYKKLADEHKKANQRGSRGKRGTR